MAKIISFISIIFSTTLTFAWCGTNDIIKDTAFGMMLGVVIGAIILMVIEYKEKEERR